MHQPHTYFSTEFRGGRRAVKVRLRSLLRPAGRTGRPLLCAALLCVVLAGGLVACRTGAAPAPVPSAPEEIDLSLLFQRDLGAGAPLELDGEERTAYTALLRERMEAAYTVMADCMGLSAAPLMGELGEPRYDSDGEAWYLFPKYESVAAVHSAVFGAFTADGGAFLDRYLDPGGEPWLQDMDGALWWRGSGYMDGAAFLPPETYCFDSLALLSRSENRLEFALLGLGSYQDIPLERFTLVKEGGNWKLDGYGERVAGVTDSLPGGLWLAVQDMLYQDIREASGYTGEIEEIRISRLLRYPDQDGEDGDVFRIFRLYPTFLLDETAQTTPLAPALTARRYAPSGGVWLVYLVRDGGQAYLGALSPGDTGEEGSGLFRAYRDLLLAQWEVKWGATPPLYPPEEL